MVTYTWISGNPVPENLETYRHKPKITNLGQQVIRVKFRFETVYIILEPGQTEITTAALIMPNGEVLHGIGLSDWYSVITTTKIENKIWRDMLWERNLENAKTYLKETFGIT